VHPLPRPRLKRPSGSPLRHPSHADRATTGRAGEYHACEYDCGAGHHHATAGSVAFHNLERVKHDDATCEGGCHADAIRSRAAEARAGATAASAEAAHSADSSSADSDQAFAAGRRTRCGHAFVIAAARRPGACACSRAHTAGRRAHLHFRADVGYALAQGFAVHPGDTVLEG